MIQSIPLVQGIYDGQQIQAIQGRIDQGEIDVYDLDDLTTDNTLYINMNGTTGDLDPFIALTTGNASLLDIVAIFESEINAAIENGQDYKSAISQTADHLFLEWDDDSGWGYAATFGWNVSEDGDYKLLVIGAPLRMTFGNYDLLVGLNSPELMNGTGEPTGDIIAVLDQAESQGGKGIQEIAGELTPERPSVNFAIEAVSCGDDLYLFLESTSGDQTPIAILYDFGGKVIRTSNESEDGSNATMTYTFQEHCIYRLEILGLTTENTTFRVLVGLNMPEALRGNATPGGQQVLETAIQVRIGLEVDQITDVDQRAENFAIVGNLWMSWSDPRLAYSPDTCQCSEKVFRSTDEFVDEYGDLWPEFTLYNQQGNRWTQNQYIVVQPNGTAVYFERFWVTLQAPDFNFQDFPFDSQKFFVRVLCMYNDEKYSFVAWPDKNTMGEQLGEEEWKVVSYDTMVKSENITNYNSMFSFDFVADRNMNYYIIRIFFPLTIIFGLTWVTWSISDYGRRIAVATGNLLLFIAFSFTIGDDLPRLGYLTIMDKVLISLFIWTALVVAYNFYMSRLTEKRREELSQKIDRILVWGFPFAFILTYLLISWTFN